MVVFRGSINNSSARSRYQPISKESRQSNRLFSFWKFLVAFILIGGVVLIYIFNFFKLQTMPERDSRLILPKSVKPFKYEIEIKPNLDDWTFEGLAKVDIDILSDTKTIQFNASELNIASVVLNYTKEKDKQQTCEITEMSFNEDVVTVVIPETLPKHTAGVLTIKYSGTISGANSLSGFYRSIYKDGEIERRIAVTQFEPTDARRAFPCWDEPNIKAHFSIRLIVQEKYTALSNMDVRSVSKLENGWKSVQFNETPLAPTYLIAFIIGELDYIEGSCINGNVENNVIMRVYTPKNESHMAKFALDVGLKALKFFEDYFDMKYPLPKMDMVALPDFGSGAMENWGLITYRSVLLLFDEENSTLSTKRRVASVICHELAHQWFGNLVTMDWWEELWLNEGFATWASWLAMDNLFPKWDVWTEFVVDDQRAGLSLDSLQSSHPVHVPIANPAEIPQIFDEISYSKGASVIRMLEAHLGGSQFQQGIRNYLKTYKYKNARTSDLWASLSEVSNTDVEKFIDRWIRVVGYPVVVIEGEDKVVVEQSRFLLTSDVAKTDESIWHVPLNIIDLNTGKIINNSTLETRKMEISVNGSVLWKLNGLQTGFFRVKYPESHFKKFNQAIEEKKLSNQDILGLVSDSFALGVAGYQPITRALSLLSSFTKNTTVLIWNALVGQIGQLKSVWYEEPEEVIKNMECFIGSLVKNLYRTLGWVVVPNEDEQITRLRPLILSLGGENNNEKIIDEAKRRFSCFINGETEEIHPSLRHVVFSLVVKNGQKDEFQQVFELYKTIKVPDQQRYALLALTSTMDTELAQKLLDYVIMKDGNENPIRSQDCSTIVGGLSRNLKTRRMTWNHLKSNWNSYKSKFDKRSISLLTSMVRESTEHLTSMKDHNEVQNFFKNGGMIDSITKVVDQSLERIKIRSRWLDRDRRAVSSFLEKSVSQLRKKL